jgi:hypothetical protein
LLTWTSVRSFAPAGENASTCMPLAANVGSVRCATGIAPVLAHARPVGGTNRSIADSGARRGSRHDRGERERDDADPARRGGERGPGRCAYTAST